ncbi:hypothetical protein QQP08_001308 [Theobroma cacao]|nr:hypothetical protein QQP08_001308 [Theobroma cacao]
MVNDGFSNSSSDFSDKIVVIYTEGIKARICTICLNGVAHFTAKDSSPFAWATNSVKIGLRQRGNFNCFASLAKALLKERLESSMHLFIVDPVENKSVIIRYTKGLVETLIREPREELRKFSRVFVISLFHRVYLQLKCDVPSEENLSLKIQKLTWTVLFPILSYGLRESSFQINSQSNM